MRKQKKNFIKYTKMRISQMRKAIQKMSIQKAYQKSIQLNKLKIRDAQVNQFRDSTIKDGSTLPDYSPVSVSKFGKRPGPWTLYNTGDFYKSIKVEEISVVGYTMGADAKKIFLIESRLDIFNQKKVMGLNENSRESIYPNVKKDLLNELNKQSRIKLF